MNYRNRIIAELVVLCSLLIYAGSANATGVDYSVGSTQYCAQAFAQTPQVMTFSGWTVGRCGDTPPPTPPGRYESGPVSYPPSTTARIADLKSWADVFGRGTTTMPNPPLAFPGYPGSNPRIPALGRGRYVALCFTTPPGPLSLNGWIKGVSNYGGAPLLIAFNPTPGDFTGAKVIQQNDGDRYAWTLGAGSTFRKHLDPSTPYCANVKTQDQTLISTPVHLNLSFGS